MGEYALRPATPADGEFSFTLHRLAMGDYVEAIWGWDDDVQRDFHRRSFDPEITQVITVDGRDAGLLVVEHHPDELYIGRIEVHPDLQCRGIGTWLVHRVQQTAADLGQPVVLEVLDVNPRAFALYERVGFRETGRRGPNNIKIRMRWDAP